MIAVLLLPLWLVCASGWAWWVALHWITGGPARG